METSCGRRVIRKSSRTRTSTAPMLTAQRVGVPMEETAAPGSAAAVTRGDDMAVLRSSNESEVSFTAVNAAPHRERRGTLVLAGAARWEVLPSLKTVEQTR